MRFVKILHWCVSSDVVHVDFAKIVVEVLSSDSAHLRPFWSAPLMRHEPAAIAAVDAKGALGLMSATT